MATASFDGRINVYPLQSTSVETRQSTGGLSKAVDDVDFFNAPQVDSQRTTFSLPKAPKWLRRSCGASFGFGGKIVSFNAIESGAYPVSKVHISNFTVDIGIGESTVQFEKALQDKDLAGICERQRAEELDKSDETDWRVIETLTSQHPREELIRYLGFSAQADEAADGISKLTVNGNQGNNAWSDEPNVPAVKQNRLSAFFENSSEGDSFLSDLAATKGAKINNPFEIYSGSESEPDRRITRALLLGQFDRALDICLQEDRLSDAFMVAICGGQSCIEKAQKAYFNRKTGGPNYLRLLASVVGKNLWDIVYNAELGNWREVMATLCTYASVEEFPDLCETLGDRLDEQARSSEGVGTLRQDASFCYLAGSKLEKVVGIWISELEQREKSESEKISNDSSFGIHARSLQLFVKKVTVFREATNFQDKDLQATSKWKLGMLYDKYAEYADLLASFGQLRIAEKYLELLPRQYPAVEAARERIKHATKGPSTQNVPRQPLTAGRTPQRNQITGGQHGMEAPPNPSRPLQNPSSVLGPTFKTQTYPPLIQPSYKTPGNAKYEPPQQPRHSDMPLQAHGPSYPNPGLGPPPRTINASPSVPAPSKAASIGNWNDMPESFFKPVPSRRGTPGAPAQSNNPQYGYPSSAIAPGIPPPVGGQQKTNVPLPPPPKGPQRTSSPMNGAISTQQSHDRPPSATNPYAPQLVSNPVTSGQQQPVIARGGSPYNLPPSTAPATNRYAPTPNSPKEGYPLPRTNRSGGPPANPYAPQQNTNAQPRNTSDHNDDPTSSQPAGLPPRASGPPLSATGAMQSRATQSPQAGETSATPQRHRK